jgi:pimeloyl-ACP methyl ester carboxylesterase
MARTIGLGIGSLVLVIVLAVIAGLGWRAYTQTGGEAALAIRTPNGIDEGLFVQVGGAPQWITIRGRDRNNPVLLIVHGGPGNAESPFAADFVPYERDYTVVQWDQPGAGRTFERAGSRIAPDLTLSDVVSDGVEVARVVRARLHANKVIVVGWSWGSFVAAEMVRARPDLFAAYVSTGQLVSFRADEPINYARVLAKAQAAHNSKAVAELTASGAPPYRTLDAFLTERKWSFALSGRPATNLIFDLLGAPRYSLADCGAYLRGLMASRDHFIGRRMTGEMATFDLAADTRPFAIPVIVIEGANDDIAPASVARAWVDGVTAPRKVFVSLPGAGHSAITEEAPAFLTALNAQLQVEGGRK